MQCIVMVAAMVAALPSTVAVAMVSVMAAALPAAVTVANSSNGCSIALG